ncbi:MAG: hypothetical protein RIS76_4650 [Verrucomicrobiota bacterium]|jgi:DNA-binding transcriptional regulator GbsR (MarR family)
MSAPLARTRLEFIEVAGRVCQTVGLPRSVGQVYGLLYLSPSPLALDDIADRLSISKASVSTGTRQLVAWQAIRQVWVPGDRRDYFEAVGDLREMMRSVYSGFFSPKYAKSERKLEVLLATLESERKEGIVGRDEHDFCKERLTHLVRIQGRASKLLPLLEKLL